MSTMRRRTLGLLALGGLAISLSACGGADRTAAAAGSDGADADTARLRFTQCLRDNGVNVPDTPGGRRALRGTDDAKLRAAMQKCRKFREQAFGNITPEQRQEFRDAFTKFAACMRQNGIDLPDPGSRGAPGAGGPGAGGGRRRFDRSTPKAQAAIKACQDKLPEGGPRGRGAGALRAQ